MWRRRDDDHDSKVQESERSIRERSIRDERERAKEKERDER
jgi:hypothetical protein